MIKLSYQNLGSSWAVGIESNERGEILHQYYSFYNWKATSGELLWLSDTFGYIWTTEERLFQYFILIEKLKYDTDRIISTPLQKRLEKAASERMEDMESENFLTYKETESLAYNIGNQVEDCYE